ncbi:hypothetical protein Rrhod_0326 [Rhodococcus rhodnii LMG 5362]|uniref:Uncharacterized protein n=1 Tax=Rhodococcus rhodnii LMG 5362 TaxID=1273125 RepID=R7WST0_9NOCA|nr:hypothetical protein Rrhod_0326 [Rhodococcus rhodnii LMG 5362]
MHGLPVRTRGSHRLAAHEREPCLPRGYLRGVRARPAVRGDRAQNPRVACAHGTRAGRIDRASLRDRAQGIRSRRSTQLLRAFRRGTESHGGRSRRRRGAGPRSRASARRSTLRDRRSP